MNTLWLSTNLTSTEMAAWVQAVGSILAILGAFWVAAWQAKKQFKNAMTLQRGERESAKFQTAKTLELLAKNCVKAMEYLSSQISSQDQVYKIGAGRTHFDIGEIVRLDDAIASIPLHDLPAELLQQTLILGATIRQYREKVEQVLRIRLDMDSSDFEGFFVDLADLRDSLSKTCDEISADVDRFRSANNKTT